MHHSAPHVVHTCRHCEGTVGVIIYNICILMLADTLLNVWYIDKGTLVTLCRMVGRGFVHLSSETNHVSR
jgi:hypothetical protein